MVDLEPFERVFVCQVDSAVAIANKSHSHYDCVYGDISRSVELGRSRS